MEEQYPSQTSGQHTNATPPHTHTNMNTHCVLMPFGFTSQYKGGRATLGSVDGLPGGGLGVSLSALSLLAASGVKLQRCTAQLPSIWRSGWFCVLPSPSGRPGVLGQSLGVPGTHALLPFHSPRNSTCLKMYFPFPATLFFLP